LPPLLPPLEPVEDTAERPFPLDFPGAFLAADNADRPLPPPEPRPRLVDVMDKPWPRLALPGAGPASVLTPAMLIIS
jgi:hypothetical protein